MADSPRSNEKPVDFGLVDKYFPLQGGNAQQGEPAGEEHASYEQTSTPAWDQGHLVEPDGGMEFIQPGNEIIHYAYSAFSELPTPPVNDAEMEAAHQMDLRSESRHVYGGQRGPSLQFNPREVQPSYPPTLGEVSYPVDEPLMQQTYGVAGQHSYSVPMETGNASTIPNVTAVGTRKRQQKWTRKKAEPANGNKRQQSLKPQVPAYSQQHVTNKAGTSQARKPRRQPTVDPSTGVMILISTGHPQGCKCAKCVEHRANQAENSRNHAARQKEEITCLTAMVKCLETQLAVEKAKSKQVESPLLLAMEKRWEQRFTDMENSLKEIKDTLKTIMANIMSTGNDEKGQAKRAERSSRQARAASPTLQQDPMTCSANVNDFHAT